MRRTLIGTFAAFAVMLSPTALVHAQAASGGAWQFTIEPYLMVPNMKGTTGLGTLPDVSVDAGPDEIFENFESGGMLYAEARNDTWAVSSDFTYMKLGADAEPRLLIESGDVELKQLAWELAVLRRLSPWLEAGVGAQLNEIQSELNLTLNAIGPGGPPQVGGQIDESWVDPTLIVRAQFPLSDKWSLMARGNVGGFGVGSDFAWQLQVYAGWRISDLMSLSFGYRMIGIDYEHGSGQDRFLYDMDTFGPVVRFGFNF